MLDKGAIGTQVGLATCHRGGGWDADQSRFDDLHRPGARPSWLFFRASYAVMSMGVMTRPRTMQRAKASDER